MMQGLSSSQKWFLYMQVFAGILTLGFVIMMRTIIQPKTTECALEGLHQVMGPLCDPPYRLWECDEPLIPTHDFDRFMQEDDWVKFRLWLHFASPHFTTNEELFYGICGKTMGEQPPRCPGSPGRSKNKNEIEFNAMLIDDQSISYPPGSEWKVPTLIDDPLCQQCVFLSMHYARVFIFYWTFVCLIWLFVWFRSSRKTNTKKD